MDIITTMFDHGTQVKVLIKAESLEEARNDLPRLLQEGKIFFLEEVSHATDTSKLNFGEGQE